MKLIIKIVFGILTAAAITAAVFYVYAPVAAPESEPLPQVKEGMVKEKEYINLLFAGDIMFDRGIRHYASKNGGNDFIIEKIKQELLRHNLVIANLEGPLTDNKSVSSGTIPGSPNNYIFTFDPSVAETLYNHNIRLVGLNNNHILNFGQGGLTSTKTYLDEANIGYFGSPDYPRSASFELEGMKITVVGYNEFSKLGGLEGKTVLGELEQVKKNADIVIVFCHWGAEYVGPDQAMRNLGRQFIDSGADLVIGSHPHVIGPMEEYNGKRIYYSLGNFIFDQYFEEDVRNGLGVSIKIDPKTREMNFTEINFYLDSNGQTVLK